MSDPTIIIPPSPPVSPGVVLPTPPAPPPQPSVAIPVPQSSPESPAFVTPPPFQFETTIPEVSTPAAPDIVAPEVSPDVVPAETDNPPVSVAAPVPAEDSEQVAPESPLVPAAEHAVTQEHPVSSTPPAGETSVTQAPAVASAPPPEVREVVVEKEKPLTAQDKDEIFHDKLKENLTEANRKKHEHYEAHLREIVDFIRHQGTLVTNQDIEQGLAMPDSTVTKRLNDLIRRGEVQRLGDQRHAKYKLTSAL